MCRTEGVLRIRFFYNLYVMNLLHGYLSVIYICCIFAVWKMKTSGRSYSQKNYYK